MLFGAKPWAAGTTLYQQTLSGLHLTLHDANVTFHDAESCTSSRGNDDLCDCLLLAHLSMYMAAVLSCVFATRRQTNAL